MARIGAIRLPCRLLHELRDKFECYLYNENCSFGQHIATDDSKLKRFKRTYEHQRRERKKMKFPVCHLYVILSVTQAAHNWLLSVFMTHMLIEHTSSSLQRLLEARCSPCEVLLLQASYFKHAKFSCSVGSLSIQHTTRIFLANYLTF